MLLLSMTPFAGRHRCHIIVVCICNALWLSCPLLCDTSLLCCFCIVHIGCPFCRRRAAVRPELEPENKILSNVQMCNNNKIKVVATAVATAAGCCRCSVRRTFSLEFLFYFIFIVCSRSVSCSHPTVQIKCRFMKNIST